MQPIPEHLQQFAWYAPHQAWLKQAGYVSHDPGGALPKQAGIKMICNSVDLKGAYLNGINLTQSNLTLADVPVIDNIDAKILAAIDAGGTLNMGDWHDCETAHCRGGWAIHLAGKDGYSLERKVCSWTAGLLIYAVSRPNKTLPDFYASDAATMADLRACAGVTE